MKSFATMIPLSLFTMISTLAFGGEMELPPIEGSPALQAMKSLAGSWEGTHVMDGKEIPATVEYKVSSNGSSVVETHFPGTPHEMITVYHDKGDKLAMTHYCSVGNQPQFDLVHMEGNALTFSLSSSNPSSLGEEGHMHDLILTMPDSDHLQQEWTFYDKGQSGGSTTFTLVRVR